MHSLTLIGGNGRSRDGNLPDCSVHTTGSRTASQLNGTVAARIDEKWIHYRLSLLSLVVVTSEASDSAARGIQIFTQIFILP